MIRKRRLMLRSGSEKVRCSTRLSGCLRAGLATSIAMFPALAHAEAHEFAIGVQPVYGLTYVDERSPSGGGGTVHVSYGITDALAVQVQAGATAHPLAETQIDDKTLPAGLLCTWQASAGIVYALDVVRIVPFFEASIGVLGTYTRTDASAAGPAKAASGIGAGASLGLGADYLITRRWALGVAVRFHALLTDLGHIPLYLTAGPRVLLRF